jgi:hypothetical protein
MQDELKTEDIVFYKQFTAFIREKGLLYHVKFNLINNTFTSSLKDVDQQYHLQNGSDVSMKIAGAAFKGELRPEMPAVFTTKIKLISFDANQSGAKALLYLKNFQASERFVSFSDYESAVSLDAMRMLIDGTENDLNLSVKSFTTASQATAKGERVTMDSKTALQALDLTSLTLSLSARKFDNSIAIKGVERASLEKISTIIAKSQNVNALSGQQEFQQAVMQLLAKGLHIKLTKLSLDDLLLDKTEDLGGFDISMDMDIKEDAKLAEKMQKSPLLFLANIRLNAAIQLSEAIYEKLLNGSPMAATMSSYAKKEHGNVLFNIAFQDAKLQVNGKTVQ